MYIIYYILLTGGSSAAASKPKGPNGINKSTGCGGHLELGSF